MEQEAYRDLELPALPDIRVQTCLVTFVDSEDINTKNIKQTKKKYFNLQKAHVERNIHGSSSRRNCHTKLCLFTNGNSKRKASYSNKAWSFECNKSLRKRRISKHWRSLPLIEFPFFQILLFIFLGVNLV